MCVFTSSTVLGPKKSFRFSKHFKKDLVSPENVSIKEGYEDNRKFSQSVDAWDIEPSLADFRPEQSKYLISKRGALFGPLFYKFSVVLLFAFTKLHHLNELSELFPKV